MTANQHLLLRAARYWSTGIPRPTPLFNEFVIAGLDVDREHAHYLARLAD